jgi:hypothetical protein
LTQQLANVGVEFAICYIERLAITLLILLENGLLRHNNRVKVSFISTEEFVKVGMVWDIFDMVEGSADAFLKMLMITFAYRNSILNTFCFCEEDVLLLTILIHFLKLFEVLGI